MYKNDTDRLIINDGNNHIMMCMLQQFDDTVEFSFRHDDETGWGCGTDEYLYIKDIKAMAEGIKNVLSGKLGEFSYICKDPFYTGPGLYNNCLETIFKMSLRYDKPTYRYTFEVSLLDTLEREHYITVRLDNIGKRDLGIYLQPFIEWDLTYPQDDDGNDLQHDTELLPIKELAYE